MPRYRSPDYANFKTSINPSNRGFWDLRVTGEYYRGIDAKVFGSVVLFSQRFSNDKIEWLHDRLVFNGQNQALGIAQNQFYDVQLKNKPKIRVHLDKIINR